jgi:SAM-dependent methyltransferase
MTDHDAARCKSFDYYSTAKTAIEPILPDRMGSVLEVGCGTGATMSWLRSNRPVDYAMGVEIVPEMAAEARSVFDKVICSNIEAAQLALDRRFDVVIALDVLEHLVDPWTSVRKLSNLLADDGFFLASIPNAAHWTLAFPLFFHGSWDYKPDGILDKTHLRFFSEETARSLFEDNNFTFEQLRYVKNYPGYSPTITWYVQKYLQPFIPSLFVNFQFLIRARKKPRTSTRSG